MKSKLQHAFLSLCLVACTIGLPACSTQEPPSSAPALLSSRTSSSAGGVVSTESDTSAPSQAEASSEAGPAPAQAPGIAARQVRETLSSGVAVDAEAVYPSDLDFSNLTAYAGTLHRFDQEAVKAALLGDAAIVHEESQEIADSLIPDALQYTYETNGAWLTVNGCNVGLTTPALENITQYFYERKGDMTYNGDKFLDGPDLPFATKQQAYDALREKLEELGLPISNQYECYVLEHTLLQSEADRLYDYFGLEELGEDKPAYTAGQNCYLFRFYGTAGGAPITAEANGIWENGGYVGGMEIEAVYSAEGIGQLSIFNAYDAGEAVSQGLGMDLDAALAWLDEKYNSIILDGGYEVQDITFEYIPVADGSPQQVTLTPAWRFGVLHTMELDAKDGSGMTGVSTYEHVMVDALSGQELLTSLGGA